MPAGPVATVLQLKLLLPGSGAEAIAEGAGFAVRGGRAVCGGGGEGSAGAAACTQAQAFPPLRSLGRNSDAKPTNARGVEWGLRPNPLESFHGTFGNVLCWWLVETETELHRSISRDG